MRRLLAKRPFWAGFACGILALLAARYAINESTVPDRLLAPLLVSDSNASADAIVVLGAGLIGDCVPNLNGMRRIVRAARLFRDGRAPLLVVTGGPGGDVCPVSEAMAAFAHDLGVPPEKTVVERESHNTLENGERTAPLLRERGVRRILLVTDRLHMVRAGGVFTRLGFIVEPSAVPIYEGHVDNVAMLFAGLREAAALAYYRLRGWTTDAAAADQHAREPRSRLDTNSRPVEHAWGEFVDRVASQTQTDARTIVILGASYAANWKLTTIGGMPVRNAGVAGQQSFEMLARFERDVVAVNPRAVVLWGFINDVFRGSDMAAALVGVRESYTEMIRRARAAGIEPILATEVTTRPAKTFVDTGKAWVGWLLGKQSYQDRVNAEVRRANTWLRETAQREGLLLLDFEATLADSSGQRRWSYAVNDGSHISAEGYEALTRYAEPILTRHLSSPTASGGDRQ